MRSRSMVSATPACAPAVAAAEPGELAPVGGDALRHEPTRATKAVMRSTNASRWNRSNCSQVVKRAGLGDPVEEEHAVEVVALVLEGARRQPPAHLVVGDAVAVELAHADVHVPRHGRPAGPAPTGSPR